MTARLLPLLLLFAVSGCDENHDITINLPTDPSKPIVSTIELRVLGNAQTVRIRHVNPVDGLSQLHTVLPYIVTIKTDLDVMFLSLDVTPTSYSFDVIAPFISAQIFVNGALFREASSADFALSTVSVSGTWRR